MELKEVIEKFKKNGCKKTIGYYTYQAFITDEFVLQFSSPEEGEVSLKAFYGVGPTIGEWKLTKEEMMAAMRALELIIAEAEEILIGIRKLESSKKFEEL